MAIVIITESLENEINNTFKKDSIKIFKLFLELENNPKKGKTVGSVGGIIIKELKYNSYRFYFITDGYQLKVLKPEEIQELLIKFVRMSKMNNQATVIEEIKHVLRNLDSEGF